MIEDKKRLIIIDGNAIIHRAYHALPSLTTKKGELVNAVYGFLLFFLKSLKEFKPDFIAASFDVPGPTFRHKKYKMYKANRPKAPDELYQQIPMIKKILKNLDVEIFEKQGYEADDVIGTISKLAKRKQIFPKIETIILSGDLDILQLVDENTKAYILKRGIKDAVLYDKKKVKEKYGGLSPEQLTDFKALRGDPSDNIPGVTGIGEKTAIFLLKDFDSLDNLYSELKKDDDKIKGLKESLKKKLLYYKEQAFISKMLAEIKRDIKINFDLKKCQKKGHNKDKLVKILKEYGFKSLIARLSEFNSNGPSPETEIIRQDNKKNKKEKKEKITENNLSLFN